MHTKRRLYERYGMDFNKYDHRALAELIQKSSGQFLVQRLSSKRALHRVTFKGQEILAIYDRNQHNIVTVLPKGAWQARGKSALAS